MSLWLPGQKRNGRRAIYSVTMPLELALILIGIIMALVATLLPLIH